jgi:hypothetical protein
MKGWTIYDAAILKKRAGNSRQAASLGATSANE